MFNRLKGMLAVSVTLLAFGSSSLLAADDIDRRALAIDIDTMMINHYLKAYYPKIVSNNGEGVNVDVGREFNSSGGGNFNLDMQSRHLWSASMAMKLHPEYDGFKKAAEAAYTYIRDKMWDKADGGSAIRAGNWGHWEGEKALYSNGYAMSGLSAYYLATGDTMALYIAKTTFRYLDSKNYDKEFGWYFGWGHDRKNQDIGHHWLEGMAWLYQVWPENAPDTVGRGLLKKRVKEMSDLFLSSKWIRNDGGIILDNNREMTNGGGDNPGLAAEDAYLIYFYYQAIGEEPTQEQKETLKKIHGYARAKGATPGQCFNVTPNSDRWWYDAEFMASLCCMGTILDAGDSYIADTKKHWEFIKDNYFDKQFGGCYKNPNDVNGPKGDGWQATYHSFKTMLFCRNWLTGSKKGWEGPISLAVKPGKKSGLKTAAPMRTSHYSYITGNKAELKNVNTLYDLRGRIMGQININGLSNNGKISGVYIAKH
jgi:mannobiose 2-epimerase